MQRLSLVLFFSNSIGKFNYTPEKFLWTSPGFLIIYLSFPYDRETDKA